MQTVVAIFPGLICTVGSALFLEDEKTRILRPFVLSAVTIYKESENCADPTNEHTEKLRQYGQ